MMSPGLYVFCVKLRNALDIVEECGRRELEEVGEEIEAAAVERSHTAAFYASLYPRVISGNRIHKHEMRRTLCRRRKQRVQRREYRLPNCKPVPLQVQEFQLQKVVELRPYQRYMSAPLPLHIRAPPPPRLRRLVPGERMQKPQPLGLALGVHVLV